MSEKTTDVKEESDKLVATSKASLNGLLLTAFGIEGDEETVKAKVAETKAAIVKGDYTVADIKDKAGLDKVKKLRNLYKTTRTSIEKKRKELNEPIAAAKKAVDDKAKELTQYLEEVEDLADKEVKRVEALIEAEKTRKAEEEKQRLQGRRTQLMAATGTKFDGTTYTNTHVENDGLDDIETPVSITEEDLKVLDDEAFGIILDKFNAAGETQKAIAEEKKRKEAEEKERQRKQQEELDKQKAEQLKKEQELAQQKKDLEEKEAKLKEQQTDKGEDGTRSMGTVSFGGVTTEVKVKDKPGVSDVEQITYSQVLEKVNDTYIGAVGVLYEDGKDAITALEFDGTLNKTQKELKFRVALNSLIKLRDAAATYAPGSPAKRDLYKQAERAIDNLDTFKLLDIIRQLAGITEQEVNSGNNLEAEGAVE